MTEITKQGLKENFDALTTFAYIHCADEWYNYCKEKRNGKQDVEELSMLIRSLTAPQPWRVIISKQSQEKLFVAIATFFSEIKVKMEENEKIVYESI